MSPIRFLDKSLSHHRGRVACLITVLLFLVVGLVSTAMPPPPIDGAYDLLITFGSQAQDAAGYCQTNGATGNETCREWCLTTEAGAVIPQGQFVCVDG